MARRALAAATLEIVQAVAAALSAEDRCLVVACSGGPDSLALAYATRHVAVASGLRYASVVVDHGLQNDSAEVAGQARATLTAIGYADVIVAKVTVPPTTTGPEAAARTVRYAALREHAGQIGGTLLLGHTRDDQAEQVLLGLARGSGTRSLAGMAARTPGLLRPLLKVSRQTTVAACSELGLRPWLDPHNADPRFSRARVRSSVLPVLEAELGPGMAQALARTADLARDDADLLDDLAAGIWARASVIDCSQLETQPPAIRRRVIRMWLIEQGSGDLTAKHLAAVDRLLTDWHGQSGIDVPGGSVVRQFERLHLISRT